MRSGDVARDIADLAAILRRELPPAEGAARGCGLAALEAEAGLHLDHQRAAERVQAIDRVGRDDAHLGDGDVGHQVPVEVVAEGLVQAHAVLVDGDARRRAEHRRGREAAVLHIRLKRVVLVGVEVDAAEALVEHRAEPGRALARGVGGGKAARVRRQLVAVDAAAGKRAGADHLDLGQGHRRLRRCRVRQRGKRERRQPPA